MNLSSKIQALLFFKNAPMSRKELAKSLNVKIEEINEAISSLQESLAQTGIMIIQKEDPARNADSIATVGGEITLGTNSELASFFRNLRKEELETDLSKASLETLTIILFKNGATRSEIDFIRGVNSTFILRILSMRGLVEKIPHPTDSRRIIYKPTFDLLGFMGLSSVNALPEYEEINKLLNDAFKNKEVESLEARPQV